MSQITYYNPMANQAFSQAASQAAQFVNAGADNQRADQQLALRQNAQQFEQELIRNANRDRLLREAKRNEANKAIFDLLKQETPNGDIGLMSQFVGLGAARGLPTMEQGIQSQVQGMAQAAQQDGFERLLRERPDAIENASPALVELLRDRGSKASATRLAEVNARIAGLERRGLAPYAKQMIDEARGLGLDMKDSLLPVRDRIEGKQQQDADKQFMLTERGFQPGTPAWEREMQRSYKFSTDLYKAHVERQAQKQAAQQAAAEQSQLVGLMGQIEQPAQSLRQANNPELGPPISLAQPGARAQYVANAVPQLTPEQRLQVGSNPGLRSMFNQEADRVAGIGQQIMQPTMGEKWQEALRAGELEAIVRDQSRPQQERFAAASMLNDMGYKTASNMPGQERPSDGGMKQIENQLGAIRSAAKSIVDQMERSNGFDKDGKPVLTDPANNARYQQLQQLYAQEQELAQKLSGAVMPASGQAGPMTLTELDAMRGGGGGAMNPADALRDSITNDLTAALGRPPTADESLAEFRRRKALRQGQR
jgi:hypothetical protein